MGKGTTKNPNSITTFILFVLHTFKSFLMRSNSIRMQKIWLLQLYFVHLQKRFNYSSIPITLQQD